MPFIYIYIYNVYVFLWHYLLAMGAGANLCPSSPYPNSLIDFGSGAGSSASPAMLVGIRKISELKWQLGRQGVLIQPNRW